jgi:hypothetical protein
MLHEALGRSINALIDDLDKLKNKKPQEEDGP